MQRIITIAALTWKAAFRFRLFIVVTVLLLAAVVGLPLILKDDGTARGFTQILLTYTMSSIIVLLGFSTLWLSCGTLARDIEECQMQMVVTKPIARWQVWLGKWLGIMSLNAALLIISGTSVYVLMQVRSNKLPPDQQHILKNEIFVARGSAKERNYDAEIDKIAEGAMEEQVKKNPEVKANLDEVAKSIREQVKAQIQVVPVGMVRVWQIDLGPFAKTLLRDQPLYLRVKFNAAQPSASGTYYAMWEVGQQDGKSSLYASGAMSFSPDDFHEFEIPPNLMDDKGVLTIAFRNINGVALLFPLDDGMEVLYREGSFGLNFARALGIIFCWMSLLAAVGLAAASLLSFPVAAFVSLGLLFVVMSSNTLATVVSDGRYFYYNAEKGQLGPPSILDRTIVKSFHGMLILIDMVKDFSPVDSLSRGRSITWMELGRAFAQIVLLMGGIVSTIGIFIFNRRELATAQGTQ